MEDKSAAQQIDAILKKYDDWRGEMLSRLRALIKQADPALVEEVKWKKPSRPEGVPVWSHDGILCFCDTLKNAVRLTFPKGAQMKDPQKLFNTRLDSKTVRAYMKAIIYDDFLACLLSTYCTEGLTALSVR